MINTQTHVENLTNLGLTTNEARVILALSGSDPITAKSISKSTGIAREIVYQTLARLVKKQLVEEVLTSPKTYRALSMKEVYAILFQKRKKETKELISKAKQALVDQQNVAISQKLENCETSVVFARAKGKCKIMEAYRQVKSSVDIVIPPDKFTEWIQEKAEWSINQVMKRGAKINIVTQKQSRKMTAIFSENITPNITSIQKQVNIRYIENPPLIESIMFDKKTVFIALQKEKFIEDMPWLCSHNQSIIALANFYFESNWNQSKTRVIN